MTAKQEISDLAVGSVPIGYSGYVLWGGNPAEWATFLAILCSLCLLVSYAYRFTLWAWIRWHEWRNR